MNKEKEIARNVMENLFMHSKPVKMMLCLKSDSVRYATQVSKVSNCTYSHTVKVLDLFRRLGLVTFDKKGRIKIVKLTSDGLDLAHDFEGISRKYGRISANIKEPFAEKTPKLKK